MGLGKINGCHRASDCLTSCCGCREGGYPCRTVCEKCQLEECPNVEITEVESEYQIDMSAYINIL